MSKGFFSTLKDPNFNSSNHNLVITFLIKLIIITIIMIIIKICLIGIFTYLYYSIIDAA